MSAEQDRFKAMTWQSPEFLPVSVGILPAAWMKYRQELDAIVRRHPLLFGAARDRDYDAVGGTYVAGDHVDAWGCTWSNIHTGMEAFVTGHPCPQREDVRRLQAPQEDAGLPHGFMFLRLTYLRGFEEAMMDFAEEPPELQRMIDIVCAYNVRQTHRYLEKLSAAPDQILYFGDDLGMQTSLPVSPAAWRKYLKPAFTRIYAPVRAAGHHVYMHTDGHILPVIPDLIDAGVEVVNPQVRANGLAGLRAQCLDKICVDLDLDRQMFPFCTPDDIHAHVQEAVATLGTPAGGLWLKAEIGEDVPLANVEAICTALEWARTAFQKEAGKAGQARRAKARACA